MQKLKLYNVQIMKYVRHYDFQMTANEMPISGHYETITAVIQTKSHSINIIYNFQNSIKSTSTIGLTCNEQFYRPLYKEAACKI